MTPFPPSRWRFLAAGLFACAAGNAVAALSSDEIARLCASAEDNADCGRRIEAVLVKTLPNGIVQRDGDTLIVQRAKKNGAGDMPAKRGDDGGKTGPAIVSGTNIALETAEAPTPFRSAQTSRPANDDRTAAANETRAALRFTDRPDAVRDVSYAVWDYLPAPDAVILYVSGNAGAHFLWVARGSGATVSLPAEPVLSADKKRLATADFCSEGCANEVAVWLLDGGVPVKRLAWSPAENWSDGDVAWQANGNALDIRYQKKDNDQTQRLTRPLDAADWRRVKP